MKAGDTVDIMVGIGLRTIWEYDWTIDLIYGEWALVSRHGSDVAGFPLTQRKKIELCRIRKPSPEDRPLPKVGAGVMYKVPKSYRDQEWKFSFVLERNKKSIKVLHDNEVISRAFDHFIEVVE